MRIACRARRFACAMRQAKAGRDALLMDGAPSVCFSSQGETEPRKMPNKAAPPPVIRQVKGLMQRTSAWRAQGLRVALVPTMGALHEGHISLVRMAARRADRVIVSIFVNPAQFAPHEDFAAYPRTLARDRARLEGSGADLIWAPNGSTMYRQGFATRVETGGPALAGLEDRFRPHFFAGVTTIVAKLFLQCQPDIAVFGEKDFQQLAVIRQMARDLDMNIAILGAPVRREKDGLAMSSRNVYLDADARARAPALFGALHEAARAIRAGALPASALRVARKAIAGAGFDIDYVEARDAKTLAPVRGRGKAKLRLLAAARIGTTRLIDNVAV